MNLSFPKRFLIITGVLYAGAFLFFLVFNIIEFAPKEIDLYFKNGWIINKSLLNFFDNLIPVQCTAIIYTFSVFYPRVQSESGMQLLTSKNFNHIITIIIIILLSLTALFFTGNEIFKPGLHEKIDSYAYLTKTSRAYFDQAKTAAEEGQLFDAEDSIKRYLAIKSEDPEGLELFRSISKRIDNMYAADINESVSTEQPDTMELSYDAALRLARNYLNSEDYYSAYYYAQIASQLSGGAEDAKGLSSEAWTALSKTKPSQQETEAFSLYSRKKRGTELLLARKPIEAYYLFNQLSIEYPSDPDVIKYLNESINRTRDLTYFIDEAEEALLFPGINDICFLNTNTEVERGLYFFGKMVILAEGTYFEDIEIINFSADQGVTRHLTAKYGKLVGDHIVLNGIDRENKSLRIIPEYIISDSLPELYNTIKLNVDRHHLPGLSSSGNIYKKLNLIELIEFEPVISGYGWMVEPLYIEIITRILNPCAFIILSLIMISLSWKYRRFSGKITIVGLVLSPVVIYIIALLSEAYVYALKLLCSSIFLGFGKPAALALLIASQIILMILAFLLIAGLRTTENSNKE